MCTNRAGPAAYTRLESSPISRIPSLPALEQGLPLLEGLLIEEEWQVAVVEGPQHFHHRLFLLVGGRLDLVLARRPLLVLRSPRSRVLQDSSPAARSYCRSGSRLRRPRISPSQSRLRWHQPRPAVPSTRA